uniref:Uncharacterized protein n=1 Tax=Graphocephala atropunctata TaxID=36148 RepID=A0A1B6KVV6_9HEMI
MHKQGSFNTFNTDINLKYITQMFISLSQNSTNSRECTNSRESTATNSRESIDTTADPTSTSTSGSAEALTQQLPTTVEIYSVLADPAEPVGRGDPGHSHSSSPQHATGRIRRRPQVDQAGSTVDDSDSQSQAQKN